MVSAFQNVSAQHLADLHHDIDCDVLVCGDDTAACNLTIGLIRDIGMRGLYAGTIRNSAAVEALTSVLIAINRRHKVTGSGIRITGLPESVAARRRRHFAARPVDNPDHYAGGYRRPTADGKREHRCRGHRKLPSWGPESAD